MANTLTRLCFSVVFPSLCWALNPSTPVTQFDRDSWGLREGLPHLSIPALQQSRDGYLWIGSVNGLVRFDGVRFTSFAAQENKPGISGSVITVIHQGAEGTLWIGTDKCLYAYKQDTLREHRLGNKSLIIWSIQAAVDGTLWVGTSEGLFRQNQGKWRQFTTADGLPSNKINSIAIDQQGIIWLATSAGLTRFDGRLFSTLSERDGLTSNQVNSLLASRDGALWIGTENGLNCYRQGKLLTMKFQGDQLTIGPPGRPTSLLSKVQLMQDTQGAIWIGTAESGLARYWNGSVQWLTKQQGLPSNSIKKIFEDAEGNLWLGSRDAGLIRLREPSSLSYSAMSGLRGEVVYSIWPEAPDRLWVSTDKGISRIDGYRITNEALPARLGLTNVYSILREPSGRFWFAIRGGGLKSWDGRNLRSFAKKDGLGSDSVWALALAKDGVLWAATSGGLSSISQGKIVNYDRQAGLPEQFVSTVLADRSGALWVGTWGGGLCRWNGKKALRLSRQAEDLGMVRVLFEDGTGRIWLGAQAGLGLVQSDRLLSLARAHPYFSATVRSISEDRWGRLWLNTTKGLVIANIAELLEIAQGKKATASNVRTLGGAGELPTLLQTVAPQPNGIHLHAGRIWFVSRQAVLGIDPEHLPENSLPPPVVVETFRVNGVPRKLGPEVTIAPGIERLEFEYTSLSLTAPERNQFRFRLIGFDRTWADAGTRRFASYTNLSPGDYVFEVQGSNNDGIWGHARPLRLKVQAYFYQTRWFAFTGAFCAAAVMIVLYRFRLRQWEVRHALVLNERTRLARELHDTLLQSFSGVSMQLGAVQRRLQQGATEAGEEQLGHVLTQVDRCLAEARESVWDLRSPTIADSSLGQALASLCQEAETPTCEVHCKIDSAVPALPHFTKKQLLRIAQEALTNSLRHARATQIWVELSFHQEVVRLSVRDNGCGFDVNQQRAVTEGHWGLIGMQERAREAHARLTVRSEAGKGAEVVAEAPISQAVSPTSKAWFRR